MLKHALSLMRTIGMALEPDDNDVLCLEPSIHFICSHVRSKAAPSKITAEMRAIIIARH